MSERYQTHPEFRNGAHNRLMGFSMNKSYEHIGPHDHDGRQENRRGWVAMDEYLTMQELVTLTVEVSDD